jgi:hypothetical protein
LEGSKEYDHEVAVILEKKKLREPLIPNSFISYDYLRRFGKIDPLRPLAVSKIPLTVERLLWAAWNNKKQKVGDKSTWGSPFV